jgi:hypothetical protein
MHLKKRIICSGILLLLMPALTPLMAQHIELTPFIGYETGAQMYTNQGDLHISDGMNYGGALSIGLGSGMNVETAYNHLSSELWLDAEITGAKNLTAINVDYYTLGVIKELMPDKKATPYGLFQLGMVNYAPLDDSYDSEQKFDIDLGLGLKIKASERVGFRVQARLHLPMYWNGIYFGGGSGGAAYGVTSTVIMVQGDFTGSVYFVLK